MLDNPVFLSFVFYSVLLILKMYIIAIITGQVRLHKKAFANPEDAMRHGGTQYYREDPDVERCKRSHHNDMENIFPFLFLGAIYSMTEPGLFFARMHFLVFFLGRVVHSVAYLCALKAPTRSVAYVIAQVPCFSMLLQILYAVGVQW
ncbi:prostaglandin E synthase [Scleropages formosus]|uniref:Prostaglandin E synthase n=1 Tax=Scleropages formosus TaxID=113540 RepID=A0A8C9W931_SCLFO|nr:prostaglandin E synthase [Scleropages formosus]